MKLRRGGEKASNSVDGAGRGEGVDTFIRLRVGQGGYEVECREERGMEGKGGSSEAVVRNMQ